MVASDDLFPFYRICNGKVAAKRMLPTVSMRLFVFSNCPKAKSSRFCGAYPYGYTAKAAVK